MFSISQNLVKRHEAAKDIVLVTLEIAVFNKS